MLRGAWTRLLFPTWKLRFIYETHVGTPISINRIPIIAFFESFFTAVHMYWRASRTRLAIQKSLSTGPSSSYHTRVRFIIILASIIILPKDFVITDLKISIHSSVSKDSIWAGIIELSASWSLIFNCRAVKSWNQFAIFAPIEQIKVSVIALLIHEGQFSAISAVIANREVKFIGKTGVVLIPLTLSAPPVRVESIVTFFFWLHEVSIPAGWAKRSYMRLGEVSSFWAIKSRLSHMLGFSKHLLFCFEVLLCMDLHNCSLKTWAENNFIEIFRIWLIFKV